MVIKPVKHSFPPPAKLCMYSTAPEVIKKAPKEATNGQGLGSTKCQV